jgi:hypothetical protein
MSDCLCSHLQKYEKHDEYDSYDKYDKYGKSHDKVSNAAAPALYLLRLAWPCCPM